MDAAQPSALQKALGSVDCESIADRRFVALLTLDSGMRYGLHFDVDEQGVVTHAPAWAVEREGALTCFDVDTAKHFVEVLEHDRRQFEERLEARAREVGLPEMDVVFSFPAFDLVRAMMSSESHHYMRLGMSWLLPSELRELRAALITIRDNGELPDRLRSLAHRLVVPE